MSYVKICKYCIGEGRLRVDFLPIIKRKCPNCDSTGKVHVGWDKNQLKLKKLSMR